MNAIPKNHDTLRIVLIRPGSTDLDDQGRIKGTLNIPLSPNGENEVRKTAEQLLHLDIEAIYCSPCLAAQQTAQQLSHDGKIKVKIDDNLLNLDHGLWHGKRITELKETQPKLFKQWQERPETVCPPGGETVEAVRKRVDRMLKKLRKKYKKGVIAIVAPEPLSSIIRSVVENSEIENLARCEVKCGGWSTVEFPVDAVA
jgi:broad specificity phosphatase PhoE